MVPPKKSQRSEDFAVASVTVPWSAEVLGIVAATSEEAEDGACFLEEILEEMNAYRGTHWDPH